LAILLLLLPDGCHFADNTKFNYNWQQKRLHSSSTAAAYQKQKRKRKSRLKLKSQRTIELANKPEWSGVANATATAT